MRIAIVGAGVMGRTLAWQLLRDAEGQDKDVHLTLYDRDPVDHGAAAAYTAAGMLTPYCEASATEALVFQLGMEGLSLWPQLVASLQEDLDFHQRGSIVVAHDADRSEYQRFHQQLSHRLPVAAHEYVSTVAGDEFRQRFAPLSQRFDHGIYIAAESWVNSHRYMASIARRLGEAGVTWHSECEVQSMQEKAGNAEVTCRAGSEQFDHVVDCRGMGAQEDIADLRGVRGEVLTLYAPEVEIKYLVRLMHPRYRLYLVPRKDHHYLLGATQIESDDTGPITVRSALELLSAAYSLHPGFAEARVVHTAANCRPALPDNLPRVQRQQHLTRINGLFRHGYLLAPIIAQEASRCLLDEAAEPQHPQLFH